MFQRYLMLSGAALGVALMTGPAFAQDGGVDALRGEACVGLVVHERAVDPLPATGPDGAVGSIPADRPGYVLAVTSCDDNTLSVQYQGAEWTVSKSLVGYRWLQTGDAMAGGARITEAMRAKAVTKPPEEYILDEADLPYCDSLNTVGATSSSRIFGASGLSSGTQPRCRQR